MRQVEKLQFYCSSADRTNPNDSTGSFSINIQQTFADDEDLYVKWYVQSACVRYDQAPINATNNLFIYTPDVSVPGTYVTYTIPTGAPSVASIIAWWNGTVLTPNTGFFANGVWSQAGPGQQMPLFWDASTWKFQLQPNSFSGTSYSIGFPTTNSAALLFGGYPGAYYTVPAPSATVVAVEFPNVVSMSVPKAVIMGCSFGDNSRFTIHSGSTAVTNQTAFMPILNGFLSNVCYTDQSGSNGCLMRTSRQQQWTLKIELYLDPYITQASGAIVSTPFVPLNDWPFVLAAELWRDDDAVNTKQLQTANEHLSDVLHVLQIQTVSKELNQKRALLKSADLFIPLPVDLAYDPDTNATEDQQPLANDPSRYPQPPPDYGAIGLVPQGYERFFSLNSEQAVRDQLVRAQGPKPEKRPRPEFQEGEIL